MWSRLAPAGNFSSPLAVLQTALRVRAAKRSPSGSSRSAAELERNLKDFSGADNVTLTSDGKQALYWALLAAKALLGVRRVYLAGFTCPEIASAAVKAGLRLHPLDVAQDSLQWEPGVTIPQADGAPGLLVLSNLFGLPDSIPTSISPEMLVIDDACQSLLSLDQLNRRVGSRAALGIASFGRGKALSGIGGGALLFNNDHTLALPLKAALKEAFSNREIAAGRWPGATDDVMLTMQEALKLTCYYTMEQPPLYGLISRIPGTGLGNVSCELEFDEPRRSAGSWLSAVTQLEAAKNDIKHRRVLMQKWKQELTGLPLHQIVSSDHDQALTVLTRFPLLFESRDQRNLALQLLNRQGLGASASYNAALTEMPHLKPYIDQPHCPNSSSLAARLITLPVHRFVTDKTIEQTSSILKQVCKC